MNKLIIYILGLVTFAGCSASKETFTIKKVLNSGCASNAAMSIQKYSLIILERFYSTNNEMPNNFSYRKFIANKDTLISDKFFQPKLSASEDTINSMKKAPLFIDTVFTHVFKYDEIPVSLSDLFNTNEEIVSFKSQSPYWFYLSRNNQTSIWKLYVSKENSKKAISIALPFEPEAPNFLLFDIIGDSKPEILIFRNTYFMKRDLVYIDIYKIEY